MWGADTGGDGRNHHEAGEGASSRHWQAQSKENEMTCVLERGRSHCEEAQMVTIEHDQQSYRVGVPDFASMQQKMAVFKGEGEEGRFGAVRGGRVSTWVLDSASSRAGSVCVGWVSSST
ncbi:hypothetical protein AHAS_Ahas20G0052200 [Arachis hypogaea]